MNASVEFLKYWILVADLAVEGLVFPTIKWQWEDNFKLILLISLCKIIRHDLVTQHTGCVNGCPHANYTPLTMQRKCSFSTCPWCTTHFSLSNNPKYEMNSNIYRSISEKNNWFCGRSSKSMIHYFKCIPGEKKDVILKLNPLAFF